MQETSTLRDSRALSDALAPTVVIIPARNEAASLGFVLHDLPHTAAVLVADNGATDATAEIGRKQGCIVVEEPIPGYGRACLAGMHRLGELKAANSVDCRYVAFLDADYRDHPEELERLLIEMLKRDLDFVVGSRTIGDREPGAMPIQALLGNRLACALLHCI